jgi:transcription elongation GreA/GreB family factor
LARLHQERAALQADDHAGQARIARDLRYWASRQSSAQLVRGPSDPGVVRFGSTVTISRDDGRRQTWRIVGEDEADPTRGTLSHVSPVARALMGKQVGDVVSVSGSDAEIVRIEPSGE